MAGEAKLVGALVGGLRILRYLGRQGEPTGVNRIARDLKLNPSTCFNLLRTLVHEQLAVMDPETKTYSIGLGLVELARGTLDQVSYVRFVRPSLERIATEHNVTTTLWQRSNADHVVLVDYAESGSAIRLHMSIGQRLPWNIAALGRCFAAHSGLDQAELKSEFDKLRWEIPITFETYMDEVADARRKGFAVDQEHYVKGVTTVSAPVFVAGRAIMALSTVGVSAQFTRAALTRLSHDLRDTARSVSGVIAGAAPAKS
jgi:DNA-binding IclR family transcriptional regulator